MIMEYSGCQKVALWQLTPDLKGKRGGSPFRIRSVWNQWKHVFLSDLGSGDET